MRNRVLHLYGSLGLLTVCCPTAMDAWFGSRRWKRQRQNIRTWPSIALCSSTTPGGEKQNMPQPTRLDTDDVRDDDDDGDDGDDAFVRLEYVGDDDTNQSDGGGLSGGRIAGKTSSRDNPRFPRIASPKTSTNVSSRRGMTDGRLRLKWGIDVDIQVTV